MCCIQFTGIKICVTVWIFIIIIIGHTRVKGGLQENMAFPSMLGALHPEIAILMDMGDNTKVNGMDQHIADTIKRWIKYSVPEGESIGVAQIGSSNKIHLPMTIMEDMNQRITLASKIKPVVHGESNPLKGIHIAEKMISKEGGFIVIVSHEKWVEPYIGANEKKTLLNVLERSLKIVNIFFSMTTSACTPNNELNSHAQFLNIRENSLNIKHEMRVIHAETALEEIMAVYPSEWGHNNMSTFIILEEETQINQKSDESTDVSLIVFSCTQFKRLDISVQLLRGGDICELSHNLPECNETRNGIDNELNTSWISYPCNLTGTWTISLSCPSNNNETCIYKVLTKVTEVCAFEKDGNEKSIDFKCFACNDWKTHSHFGNKLNLENSLCVRGDNYVYWNDIDPQPVTILSQIEENHHHLEYSNITVTAEEISSQINTYMNTKEILELHDGGWGADRTNGDGIYSGYFYPSQNSYNDCLSSSTPCNFSLVCSVTGYKYGYGKYQFQIRGPPFQFQKADEPYPPNKIRDLKGEQETSHKINLTWTAAGRSLGRGKVYEYAFQFMDECDDNSSISNGHKKNQNFKNRKNEGIYFKHPSSPGEISKNSVSLGDSWRKTRMSPDAKICFVLEAIGECHKKTISNCACAILKFTGDSSNISYIRIILLTTLVPIALILVICAWKWKRLLQCCPNLLQRHRRRNALEHQTHFEDQLVEVQQLEAQPL